MPPTPPPPYSPPGLAARRLAAGLVALYCVSVVGRFAGGWLMSLPLIRPDEWAHLDAARTVLRGHGIFLGGYAMHDPNWLYALAVAPVLRWLGPVAGVTGVRLLNALMISTAIPLVYGMARRFLSRRRTLAAAALTALLPGMSISAQIMQENLYFPLAIGALWATLAALERPTAARRAGAGLLLALLWHTKAEGLFFPVIFAVAVVLDALCEPGLAPRERARRIGTHWLTAAVWAAVAGLRIAEAAAEGMPRPWGIDALLGSYTGRALGMLPWSWRGFAKMTVLDAIALALLTGLVPAVAAGWASARALAGRGPRRWRQAALLALAGAAVLVPACARHTIVADEVWCVYERYLMPLFPLLFGLMLAGWPAGLAATPARRRPLRILAWGAGAVALGAALWYMRYLIRWRFWYLQSNLPSMAGYWLVLFDNPPHWRTLIGWFAFGAAGAGALIVALRRAGAGGRPRATLLGFGAVAWALAMMNYGFYGSQAAILRPLLADERRIGEVLRRIIPEDGRLLVLTDGMPQNIVFHAQFAVPGEPVFLDRQEEGYWYARPLRLSAEGRVLNHAAGGPDPWADRYLLVCGDWRMTGGPVAGNGALRLYALDGDDRSRFASTAPPPRIAADETTGPLVIASAVPAIPAPVGSPRLTVADRLR